MHIHVLLIRFLYCNKLWSKTFKCDIANLFIHSFIVIFSSGVYLILPGTDKKGRRVIMARLGNLLYKLIHLINFIDRLLCNLLK